mgnify:CR=1 FL=1
MIIEIENFGKFDTSKPLSIALPLTNDNQNPRAWYVEAPIIEPVKGDGFVGTVAQGGSVNFRNISFNPHGHGTHTECLGHITNEVYSVNQCLKEYFFNAVLVTIKPAELDGDLVITKALLEEKLKGIASIEALIIRTIPNEEEKKHRNYSASNPPYLHIDCIDLFNKIDVQHLLIDTPSVDREEDGGVLAFHHAFWKVPENPQFHKTITELVFVENEIQDGNYLLELQIAAFENDASPSRPTLYKPIK